MSSESYTVVKWRDIPPFVLSSIFVTGRLTLIHSKKCTTSITFDEPTPVPDAMHALQSKIHGPHMNPKITGSIKLAQHIRVNGHVLGPLLGETVSRHLNNAKTRDWIYYVESKSPEH